MCVGLLGSHQVAARGRPFSFRRPSMRLDVTQTLLDREFLDLGSAFVGGAGFVMALQHAVARRLIALPRTGGMLGGTLGMLFGDGHFFGQFRAALEQLTRTLTGFGSAGLGHGSTVRR